MTSTLQAPKEDAATPECAGVCELKHGTKQVNSGREKHFQKQVISFKRACDGYLIAQLKLTRHAATLDRWLWVQRYRREEQRSLHAQQHQYMRSAWSCVCLAVLTKLGK